MPNGLGEPTERRTAEANAGNDSSVVLDQYSVTTTPTNDEGPTERQDVPVSFVSAGAFAPVQPHVIARKVVAIHSSLVGSRQSPGEELSVRPQSPFFRLAAA